MLNHLFATILICLGVANTTPISNYDQKESNQVLTTPKKANEINNYELTIPATQRQTLSNSVQGTGSTFYPNGTINEYKWNLTNSNPYINVVGNIYQTQYNGTIIDENNQQKTITFIDNVQKINEIGLRTCISYMYKITPYNFNIDTETTIKLYANVKTFTDINNEDFYAYELYYYRYIYKSVDLTWDQYIGRQIALETTNTIKSDIENINNGFYYTLQTDLLYIGQNENTGTYTDEIELPITPQTNNYYFIIYRPCCRFVYNTNEQTQPMQWGFFPRDYDAIKIAGTNIIPSGTYEVIDIPGLMFEVLGMPFAFVSQAFNLTLFPGTPYQINIANLFLSIAAIFVFVWLVLLFIKMKG